MAGRFRDDERPGYFHTNSSYSTDSNYHRNHDRAQSEHLPRHDYGRVPRTLNQAYSRRRSNPLNAFVEDERDALAKEHNPAFAGLLRASDDEPTPRGEIDQVPIILEVDNPERRFVILPKPPAAETGTAAGEGDGRTSGSRTSSAPGSHVSAAGSHASNASNASNASKISHDSTGSPSTITATASTITPTTSTITPTGSPSTPTGPSRGALNSGHAHPSPSRPPDKVSEYEANTCRKFTVPRIDSESGVDDSTISEPSTIGSEKDSATGTPRQRRSSLGTAADLTAAAAAAAVAAAATPSKTTPEIKRRRSRLDLPRIDTEIQHDDRAHNASSGRPRSSTHSDHRSRDRHQDSHESRDSRDRLGDRNGHRDNDFLSPTFIKHTTNGRDRAYFDHGHSHSHSSSVADSGRARSGDARSSHDDRRSHDRAERNSMSSDPSMKRRSTSFSETDRLSRQPSYKRSSRDEGAGSRAGRKSPSPPPKSRTPPSPLLRTDKRPSSPPRNRERERERDRDRERERDWERDRARERDREREREREKEREREREKEKERDRRQHEQDRDRQKPVRRDSNSFPNKRRDSIIRPDDGYSSDERSKKSSANTPLRRQNSERRRPPPPHKDNESVVSKASSNPDPRRPAAINDPGVNGRYRSGNSTPLATPKQAQAQFPFMSGSPPKELFDPPRPVSPRRRDDRRPGSSSSPSSSPESRSRTPHEGDRPRGPRPRAVHHPNVVHNPANASMPNLPPASRASTMPMPIPIPIPIPASPPSRVDSLREHDGPVRRERQRSPVDSLRSSRPSLAANPARTSGVFGHNPNTSQPYRQPAFYINIPNASPDDDVAVDVQVVPEDARRERHPERPPLVTRQAERPADRVEKSLVPLYKRYAEDVYYGRVAGLPECPRIQFSTKYRDWRTMTPYKDFLICPTCYEAGFARTQWRNEFVPATGIDPKLKTNCIYGAMPWYKVAFFFVRTFQMPTLSLLRTMFNRDEDVRLPCSGAMRVSGRWFTVQDPVNGRPVSKFTTCEQCATAITVLFPRLKGLLQDNNLTPHDTTNVCSLYYEPERKRLWKYIDVLESTNNAAVVSNSPVDVNEFINKIFDVSHYDECKRDIPVRKRQWYWMRTIPDFVVCQECFDEVVYPIVNTYRGVAGDFYKEPKELDIAACHLYSPRMRDIFMRACQNNDNGYLEKKVEERADMAADITNRIQRLPKASTADDLEQMKLMAEWKKWE